MARAAQITARAWGSEGEARTRGRLPVLLVTRGNDPSAALVAEALAGRGATPVRLDTDLFPTGVRFSLHQEGLTTGALLLTRDGPVDLMEVTAVWYRRFAPGHALPADTPMRPAAVRESRATLAGLIEVLPVFHLDAVADVRRAGVKPLQLRLAAELGLPVPRTLVTNDPEAVRQFASECPGGIVAKTLSSFVVHDEEGRELAVYTSRVREEHLDDLDGLQLSPMQFQE